MRHKYADSSQRYKYVLEWGYTKQSVVSEDFPLLADIRNEQPSTHDLGGSMSTVCPWILFPSTAKALSITPNTQM